MLKKFLILLLSIILFVQISVLAKDDFSKLVYDEANNYFETVDGYKNLINWTKKARKKYKSNKNSSTDFLSGNLRYGIYISENLNDNLNPSHIIAYILNSYVDAYKNNDKKVIITKKDVDKFFLDNNYDKTNLDDIFVVLKRLSFSFNKKHDIKNVDGIISLDEIIDESIQKENYPLIYGDLKNISSMNGRTGKALFPIMYYNYFLTGSKYKFLNEPQNFVSQVANFVSCEDIDTLYYITCEDAFNMINGKQFVGIKEN